ncbi:MAG: hypothetical protein RLZZ515_183 [Cyanobacteriota bacterium]|jgi:hypothetical protein
MEARLRRPMDSTSHRQPQVSNRFLQPHQLGVAQASRAWSPTEVFAEGQWQSVRVQLEARGWNALQIEQIHDQLRQGWPLALAENNVAVISGHCPIKARRFH